VVLISDADGLAEAGEGCLATIEMPSVHPLIAPLVYAVPVQLLAYHVAVAKGTDVDQPRNLAKSVTVELGNSQQLSLEMHKIPHFFCSIN
jgi:glucosamine--fructose-6-phosphate aminotransferase (isomerizing)